MGDVTAFYGSAQGVTAARTTTLTQDSPNVPGSAENGDLFGAATAPGDFDGDGYTDLAVGAPWRTWAATPTAARSPSCGVPRRA